MKTFFLFKLCLVISFEFEMSNLKNILLKVIRIHNTLYNYTFRIVYFNVEIDISYNTLVYYTI